jgi:hypothetical protein
VSRPLVLLMPAAILVLAALAGCTPVGSVLAGGEATSPPPRTPATSTPLPQPSETPVSPARPTIGAAGCTLTAPGSYQVADCPLLFVNGDGITVTSGTAGSIRIAGNRNTVLADTAPGARIEGQDNALVVGGDLGGLEILGDRNKVTSQGRVGSGSVAGNDNTVTGVGGVGAVTDDGARNSIGAHA